MKVMYTNKNYEVRVSEDSKEYEICNLETGVVEGAFESLPASLAQAEQMNRILLQEEWKKYAEQMYPSPKTAEQINIADFIPDEGDIEQ